jgi:hypothetical protein
VRLFIQPWWLDAVAGDSWEVVLDLAGEEIMGGWIYKLNNKFGISYIGMPLLSPYQGVFYNYPSGQKPSKRLSFEKKVIEHLIEQLPPVRYINQRFHHSFKNWMPLFWNGFSQTTRYTYLINDMSSLEDLWSSFDSSTRRTIRKAENRYKLKAVKSNDLAVFFKLNEKTFVRQNKKPPYSREFLKQIDTSAKEKDCRVILLAEDPKGCVHAGIYIVWDHDTAYYLMGGADPDLRNSGASKFLLWEAIQMMSEKVNTFDFEGSMIESIEKVFRSFGAEPTPYFRIMKYKWPFNFLKILNH